jgi:hypothetical protein
MSKSTSIADGMASKHDVRDFHNFTMGFVGSARDTTHGDNKAPEVFRDSAWPDCCGIGDTTRAWRSRA